MRVVVGITGASGVIYGIRLLENLKAEKHLIISENAKKLLEYETGYELKEAIKLAEHYYENEDLFAKISSGSFKFDALIIVPCSTSTFSKIANGIADNLITRAASVCLKERKKLIIVPRETPLSTIHLQNLAKLSQEGAVILPAMSAFYHKPKRIDDLVNFVVGRILDALGIEHKLYKRWQR
ncbi:MAG: UbiX family flavin prenyltransferase [Candidatus Thermoplasmatota archaeon]|nr:UbiX family flavin prenyltransferase [Candidatus Thermoplasmatota archaeon]MDI6855936.1 UbiX family flavin prenyltransferase [Candidatus Thermoplasmatota archaeon]MDI6887953.1 UbiX family flavin prenyltransferase [Candidatus Thermoplasmatota archaeon]